MRRFRSAATSATVLLSLAACGHETPAPVPLKLLGGMTTPFKDCSPKNDAGIRIKLPPDLNFLGLKRDVDYTDTPVSDTTDNEAGTPNDAPPPPAGTPAPRVEPFHIHTKGIAGKRWVLVKVIIPNKSSYRFYTSPAGDMMGVGSADGNAGAVLCGIRKIRGDNSPDSTDRKVASFYIDLKALKALKDDSHFNIAIIPNAFPETPIFIDPKIYNDG